MPPLPGMPEIWWLYALIGMCIIGFVAWFVATEISDHLRRRRFEKMRRENKFR